MNKQSLVVQKNGSFSLFDIKFGMSRTKVEHCLAKHKILFIDDIPFAGHDKSITIDNCLLFTTVDLLFKIKLDFFADCLCNVFFESQKAIKSEAFAVNRILEGLFVNTKTIPVKNHSDGKYYTHEFRNDEFFFGWNVCCKVDDKQSATASYYVTGNFGYIIELNNNLYDVKKCYYNTISHLKKQHNKKQILLIVILALIVFFNLIMLVSGISKNIINKVYNSTANTFASTPQKGIVFVCTSETSTKYHKNLRCRGLKSCSAEIVEEDLTNAEDMGYEKCRYCYR